ncbi:site-specific recombinase XerD [Barrientosiimonas humi]|uniref:Site-specific recombinase XerD n=1 Tax=Barrientosiimonas humi TaxID=999931 RepID=A0A542XEX5_9MICO|nr:site-specific integrase [Barrientosiimonas humi]TQL34372.1 site-specific recombinase XerD [Barrientosiimonas humi]CAG7574363.1 Putative prophage phiRv2 integrase [Barrientosiimonas humi]
MAGKKGKRGWGALRKLPSGRYQAAYTGPDARRHTAPRTFETKGDAEEWLNQERRRCADPDTWSSPADRENKRKGGVTLAEYAPGAIARRRKRGQPLSPRTIEHYRQLLDRVILPGLGALPVDKITETDVSGWYDALDPTKPTQRAHAYALLKQTIDQHIRENRAADRGAPRANPCTIDGAATTGRGKRDVDVPDVQEVAALTEAMPDRLRALVLLCAWAGLRFGEVTELRRRDLRLKQGVVRVERAVTWVGNQPQVKPPKSDAGIRDVALPPHIVDAVKTHLAQHVPSHPDALVFPATAGGDDHWQHGPFYRVFMVARDAAGRPDLRLHDLRHFSAVRAAGADATVAELMARLGHSTPGAAMRYQHRAKGRDAQIAATMSQRALEATE